MKPKAIPSAIDQLRGIPIITRNAGKASVRSDHSINRTHAAIIDPTIISAGAVTRNNFV